MIITLLLATCVFPSLFLSMSNTPPPKTAIMNTTTCSCEPSACVCDHGCHYKAAHDNPEEIIALSEKDRVKHPAPFSLLYYEPGPGSHVPGEQLFLKKLVIIPPLQPPKETLFS